MICLIVTHECFPAVQPMNESMSLYVNDTIPEPKTATDKHWRDLPWFFDERNEGRRRWRRRFDTPKEYQSSIKNLYRMATEVDSVVGAVIDELKQQGVYDKTLLVFTTDNGNLHGEHGLAEKWYAWDESVKVPLVIQDPRMPASQRGKMNDEFTLSIDLAPTLLSAAKIPVPKFMQGRDIAQLYFNPEEASKSWRKDFFYEWTQVSLSYFLRWMMQRWQSSGSIHTFYVLFPLCLLSLSTALVYSSFVYCLR